MLLGDSNIKCHQFIAESQNTSQDQPRTNRKLKASSGEVMEHVLDWGSNVTRLRILKPKSCTQHRSGKVGS